MDVALHACLADYLYGADHHLLMEDKVLRSMWKEKPSEMLKEPKILLLPACSRGFESKESPSVDFSHSSH